MNIKRAFLLLIVLFAIFIAIFQAQRSPVKTRWETAIERFEQSDREARPVKGAVVFIGSSSIASWETLAEDFAGINVINRGFGGSQIADATFYADRIVIPYQPKTVVLYAGDNDLASGKTPRQVLEDYKAFVNRIHRSLPTTKIAFISIKPSPARASLLQHMKDANAQIKAYTSRDERLVYIDVFSPMLDAHGNPRTELFGPDELHMNEEGYRLWKSVIGPHIRCGTAVSNSLSGNHSWRSKGLLIKITGKSGLNSFDHADKNEAVLIKARHLDNKRQFTTASSAFRYRSPALDR